MTKTYSGVRVLRVSKEVFQRMYSTTKPISDVGQDEQCCILFELSRFSWRKACLTFHIHQHKTYMCLVQ